MIDDNKMYSGIEAAKIAGMKTRAYIGKYVEQGYLVALTTGDMNSKRYIIKGIWLKDFIKRYKKGLRSGRKYTGEEIKDLLKKEIEKY